MGQVVAQQKNNIATQYNAMTTEQRIENEHMFFEYERLDFKMYSLRDILWFKQGHINFILPDGVDYPEGYKNNQEKGLRKILSKFRKKSIK